MPHFDHRFLPADHPLYKEALELFGVIPVPARMKLQMEVSLDLTTPVTGLPGDIQAASRATAILESLPVVPGPWSYLQRNNQTHSSHLMASDRKAWRDKYLPAGRQQQQAQPGASQPRPRQSSGQHHGKDTRARRTGGPQRQAGLPPRPSASKVLPSASTTAHRTWKTGEDLESEYGTFLRSARRRRRQPHAQAVHDQPQDEDQQHLQLQEYDDEEFEYVEDDPGEVTQGRAFSTLQQVRDRCMLM